ncbi:hypothetical protein D3C83_16490 [compost metagenome]
MRAEFADQADATLGVAESDELLSQQLHAHGRAIGLGDLGGEDRGYPVAPEEVPEQRAGAGLSQLIVLFPRERHGVLRLLVPFSPACLRARPD